MKQAKQALENECGDTFVFCPSFYHQLRAIKSIETRLMVYEAVVEYGVLGKVPDFSKVDPLGLIDGIFAAIKYVIDSTKLKRVHISNERSKAGKNGGAPKGNQNARKQPKTSKTSKTSVDVDVDENIKKPRVGIVGEILVKFLPSANNHLVELLEAEGAEAVMPDLLDFFQYCFYNNNYKYEYLGKTKKSARNGNLGIAALEALRHPVVSALKKSKRFHPPVHIKTLAEYARPIVSIGNQTGEGWFLTGEMVELIKSGASNIVCCQPFACLPNHIVGKGVIKSLRHAYPDANIVAIDYDPGASEVNQVNRIKLMLATARKNMEENDNK